MVAQQHDRHIPAELVPRCPRCGGRMTTNLRADDTFVQDPGWYTAAETLPELCLRGSPIPNPPAGARG